MGPFERVFFCLLLSFSRFLGVFFGEVIVFVVGEID